MNITTEQAANIKRLSVSLELVFMNYQAAIDPIIQIAENNLQKKFRPKIAKQKASEARKDFNNILAVLKRLSKTIEPLTESNEFDIAIDSMFKVFERYFPFTGEKQPDHFKSVSTLQSFIEKNVPNEVKGFNLCSGKVSVFKSNHVYNSYMNNLCRKIISEIHKTY